MFQVLRPLETGGFEDEGDLRVKCLNPCFHGLNLSGRAGEVARGRTVYGAKDAIEPNQHVRFRAHCFPEVTARILRRSQIHLAPPEQPRQITLHASDAEQARHLFVTHSTTGRYHDFFRILAAVA